MDKIQFILDNIPDAYNKDNDSNLYKILNPIAKELDKFLLKLDEVKKSKFIDYANSADLDKIGLLLNMKRFISENDESFRGRIKTKVPSFIGGGAISAIKQVINNYLGVEPVIIEHYKPGEGHATFTNGVMEGLKVESHDPNLKVTSGTAYVLGNKFSLNETTIPQANGFLKYNLIASGTKRIANFVGKVSGSTFANPNIAKSNISGNQTTLLIPSSGLFGEFVASYNSINKLDGLNASIDSAKVNGAIAQTLFSFNLIEEVERNIVKIPKTTTAEKVQWLKDNIAKFAFSWHGLGSSVGGNKATIAVWNVIDSGYRWAISHTSSAITKINNPFVDGRASGEINKFIDSNGFIHYIAYAEPSNGTISSIINTDYVELEIELKPSTYITNESNNILKNNQISIGQFISPNILIDTRDILDPEQHYITNTASITVQLPYLFDTSKISLEDTKEILRNTKAAGIALLIKVMDTYNESIQISDSYTTAFLMGFSGIGGNNGIGG